MQFLREISISACCLLHAFGCLAQAGTLDPAFGINGKVDFMLPNQQTNGNSISIQPDGKIVVFANGDYSTHRLHVLRYEPNGQLDSSFGVDGVYTVPLAASVFRQPEVKIQPDGKIVGVFTAGENSADEQIAVFRLLSSGKIDTAFGVSGIWQFKIENKWTLPTDFTFQPDGKIVVAGIVKDDLSGFDALAIRLNPDGSIDEAFGLSGILKFLDSDLDEYARKITCSGDHLYIAGDLKNKTGSSYNIFLLKLNLDGSFDPSFGNQGKVLFEPSGSNYLFTRGVAVSPDDKILVATDYGYFIDNVDFMLVRFTADGLPDSSFGQGGFILTQVEGDFNYARSLLIQADQKIILAGETQYKCWCPIGGLVRYHPNGQLDSIFGNAGKVIVDFGNPGRFNSAALQSDGKIVLTGSTDNGPGGDASVMNTCRLQNDYIVSISFPVTLAADISISPNPVLDNQTTCRLRLNEACITSIFLTGAAARFSQALFTQYLTAGEHQIPLSLGQGLPTGVYFLEICIGQQRVVKKVVIQ